MKCNWVFFEVNEAAPANSLHEIKPQNIQMGVVFRRRSDSNAETINAIKIDRQRVWDVFQKFDRIEGF